MHPAPGSLCPLKLAQALPHLQLRQLGRRLLVDHLQALLQPCQRAVQPRLRVGAVVLDAGRLQVQADCGCGAVGTIDTREARTGSVRERVVRRGRQRCKLGATASAVLELSCVLRCPTKQPTPDPAEWRQVQQPNHAMPAHARVGRLHSCGVDNHMGRIRMA